MNEEKKLIIESLNLKSGNYKIKKEYNRYNLYQIKDDTLGCILCGEKVNNGYLSNSTPYEIKLVELFKQAKSRNEESFIEII